jgi:hypothetical protein
LGRGRISGRRGRKGFAEDAKEDKNEYKNEYKTKIEKQY